MFVVVLQACEGANGKWEKSGDPGQRWTPNALGEGSQRARGGDRRG